MLFMLTVASFFLGAVVQLKIMYNILEPQGYKHDGADGLLFEIPAIMMGGLCAAACVAASYWTGWDLKLSTAIAVLSLPAPMVITMLIRRSVRALRTLFELCSKPL
jgi:hypothetical protein